MNPSEIEVTNASPINFDAVIFKTLETNVSTDGIQISATVNTTTSNQYWLKEHICGWEDPLSKKTRTKCVKYARIDFPPIKTCVGWKTEVSHYRNDLWLLVSSNTHKDLKSAVEQALATSVVVAALAAISTNGSAAVPAFIASFESEIVKIVKDVEVHGEPVGSWGDWKPL